MTCNLDSTQNQPVIIYRSKAEQIRDEAVTEALMNYDVAKFFGVILIVCIVVLIFDVLKKK